MEMITELVQQLLTLIDTAPWWQVLLIVGVLLVLETSVGIGLITPGEVVLLAAATAVHAPLEFVQLAAVAAGASLLGQAGGFWIGRRTGDRLRRSRLGRRLGERHWQRAERLVAGGPGRALVLSRFVSVAHSLVPVVVGSLQMAPRRFLRFTAIGVVAWSVVFVTVGSAGSAAVRSSAHLVGPAVTGGLITAVLLAVALTGVRRRWRRRVPHHAAVARTPARPGSAAVLRGDSVQS